MRTCFKHMRKRFIYENIFYVYEKAFYIDNMFYIYEKAFYIRENVLHI